MKPARLRRCSTGRALTSGRRLSSRASSAVLSSLRGFMAGTLAGSARAGVNRDEDSLGYGRKVLFLRALDRGVG